MAQPLLFRLDVPFLDDLLVNVIFDLDLLRKFLRRVGNDLRRRFLNARMHIGFVQCFLERAVELVDNVPGQAFGTVYAIPGPA
jgi:hypothetical protein